MEVEEIQTHPRSTTASTTPAPSPAAKFTKLTHQFPADDGGSNRLRGWHHSSRIIRVSRASGGKDRHSKVWTSKGLRDRRVRLSVTTAIQFYDLQDRLGYDQPSKAVEWLINAAAESISELPSLNSAAFPDTPKQLSDEKREAGGAHQLSLSKSACSSNSETSKGSGGLSLSRSEVRVNRVKARERARERAAKDKEQCQNSNISHVHHNSSFTELLTSGITNNNVSNNNNESSSSPTPNHESAHFYSKGSSSSPVTVAQMDYFATGLLNLSSRPTHHHTQVPMPIPMSSLPPQFGMAGDSSSTHFSFVPEQHLIPNGGGDYSLNFSIASSAAGGLASINRGTLQSNSSSLYSQHQQQHQHHQHHQHQHGLQRFSSSPIDASTTNIPFFFGAVGGESIHQFPANFDSRLQLCYGDPNRQSDHKGKGKN